MSTFPSSRRPFTPHERNARFACALCASALLVVGVSAHVRHVRDRSSLQLLRARTAELSARNAELSRRAAASADRSPDAGLRAENDRLSAENALLRMHLGYRRAGMVDGDSGAHPSASPFQRPSSTESSRTETGADRIPRGGGAPSRELPLPSRDE